MSELKIGMQVLHSIFGQGTVRAISGSGPSAKITVDFAANVGQKKLLASVANLTPLGESSAPQVSSVWYEVLTISAAPRPGRRVDFERLRERIRATAQRHDFWNSVREKLRATGAAPKVLDDLSGKLSITLQAHPFNLEIRIKHRELLRPNEQILAHAMFENLRHCELADFENFQPKLEFGVQHHLNETDVLTFSEVDLGMLPDRAPKRAPARVDPKGYVKPARKRYDQY